MLGGPFRRGAEADVQRSSLLLGVNQLTGDSERLRVGVEGNAEVPARPGEEAAGACAQMSQMITRHPSEACRAPPVELNSYLPPYLWKLLAVSCLASATV